MSAAGQQALAGKTVWLTRPREQSDELGEALRALGADIFVFPLLEIVPREPDTATRGLLQQLDRYDLVFYVSSNAAKAGMEAISDWWPQYPAHILNFAVGPATAAAIESYGLQVHYPRGRMDSEAMLALPQLRDIAGKKALIVRGVGGREILAAGLRERGAEVDYAELYERRMPRYEQCYMRQALERHRPDAVVLSSGEAMDNLKALLSSWYPDWAALPLHVASERLAEHAAGLGFTAVTVMAGASDAAIIEALNSIFGRQY